MFAFLGLVFPFIKAFLGDGIIEKMLAHKRAQADSANEREKMNIEADVKVLGYELERRKLQRDLQLAEYIHPLLWWPKFLLTLSVCLYWATRFFVKWSGLNDFNVAIAELSEPEAWVSGVIISALYIDGVVKRVVRK